MCVYVCLCVSMCVYVCLWVRRVTHKYVFHTLTLVYTCACPVHLDIFRVYTWLVCVYLDECICSVHMCVPLFIFRVYTWHMCALRHLSCIHMARLCIFGWVYFQCILVCALCTYASLVHICVWILCVYVYTWLVCVYLDESICSVHMCVPFVPMHL